MEKLVDLITTDKELEEIMLVEYPGKITEEKYCKINKEAGKKEYCFLNLNYSQLSRFLIQYFGICNFRIQDKKGKIIKVSVMGPIIAVA